MIPWHFPEEFPTPADLRSAVGGHPLVAEILAQRGIDTPDSARAFLDPSAYTPSSPFDLPGMELAVERLIKAVREGEPICVWGDFDVDGQTATALLVSALEQLGSAVTYHIPIRANESHGINIPVLEQVIGAGAKLLLTCDTGISALEAVRFANAQDVDVIVTDHHTPPDRLPDALALVNPKLGPSGHPADSLPGVGVAYKLVQGLYQRLDKAGEETQFLDLVALGIVADLALVKGDARYLLQRGLEELRNTARPGLRAMMELAELEPAGLSEEHIAFELGPRLNSLGRLSDANPAVELLTTRDLARARVLAAQLEGLNAQRRLLTSQVYRAAVAQIERDPSLLEGAALVLAHPAWPAGVIGIVASRLVETHRRPAALIAAPPGELARGSARSLVGIDITAAIAACQERLASFGGHPMAAGFALESKNIPAFRKDLSAAVEAQLSESWVEPALEIDGRLELGELTLELVADLERLSPFGPGNRIPVLAAGGLRLRSLRNLGRNAEHRQMAVDDQEASYKVIWWGGGDVDSPEWLKEGSLFDLAYTARRTDFRGRKELQLEWVDARPVEGTAVDIRAARPPIHVEDYRRAEHPLPELKRLLEEGDLLIWAEGDARTRLTAEGIPAVDRTGLTSCARLAVWTPPPGREIFQSALETVSPETVCLFAVDPGMDKMEPFLQRLAGLAKYALRTNAGRASISSLASATAQRASVVGAGLAWLEAQGSLKLVSTGGDEVVLGEQEKGDQGAKGIGERGGLDQISKQVRTLLTETAAFRAYYLRAEGEGLIGEEPGEQGSR